MKRMFRNADAVGNSVYVARDIDGSSKGAKDFASLGSPLELAEILFSTSDRRCSLYEIIREGMLSLLHEDLDMESAAVATEADAHRRLSHNVSCLRSFLRVSESQRLLLLSVC